ncbi:MAG: NACHT domain-containing protein, partial [bacterium]|nr:NACHT domain-containing protein [bacterium]
MSELPIAERNARVSALGRYVRWLHYRYQRLDLVEMIDEPEPISLRQIFVPARVAREDVRDEEMAKADEVRDEELPGEDAWEMLVREPLVVLSGRPGSGKTTLVQAIIVELCGEQTSTLRRQLRAVPVPLILRNIPDLEKADSLDRLLELWWPLQAEQAEQDELPLDVARLRQILFPVADKPELPVLLLFDGIDEVGGAGIRQRLLQLAFEAGERGFRVLVTGRPSGYQDLVSPAGAPDDRLPGLAGDAGLPLHHLLPFAWPQIGEFIRAWYALRKEWLRRRDAGIKRFLTHLADRARQHLLVLARRPIFLTLMALVHTTENQMPEGRPRLYKRIVDLYLDRQERHRQRKQTLAGEPMPHWPAAEIRSVLGHLAWLSQSRGSEEQKADPRDPDARRVSWPRADLEDRIRSQLSSGPGRFAQLSPDHAPALVD